MTVPELLATLRRAGIEVSVREDRLRIEAPRGAVTPEIHRALVDHKPELIAALSVPRRSPTWPPESLDAERQFGGPHARLYPFLGRTVETSSGPGRLLQVFSERAAVLLDGSDQTAYFPPADLSPFPPPANRGDLSASVR
jgi:hypothetical protein